MYNDMIYESEKFKAMIHYIIGRCQFKDNLGKNLLFDFLYFSDFDNYEIYEKSISGETYIHRRMGPVPSHFTSVINELIDEGKIEISNYPKYKYSCLEEPDIRLLSVEELQVIDDTINRISHCLSEGISEYSHGDLPWRLASEGEPLDYESVFYRDPEYSVRDYDD